jgi:hypothetical protein
LQQMSEHQAGRSGTDDPDLGAHGHHCDDLGPA